MLVSNLLTLLIIIFNVSNNCHSHVAEALCNMNYGNQTGYNMIHVWWYCMLKSKYTSWGAIFKTYIGFVIILALIIGFSRL